MRIHTKLTMQEMYDALHDSGAQETTDFEVLTQHGSHSALRAFEVRLTGSSYNVNSGRWGSSDEFQGATWDEWGAFFGSLYDLDPEARCGGSKKRPIYRDREHFHFLTGDRFQKRYPCDGCKGTYMPADAHKRHHWAWNLEGFWCTQCSAHRPSWREADAYAPRAYDLDQSA